MSLCKLAHEQAEEKPNDHSINYMPMSTTIVNHGCIHDSFDAFKKSKDKIIESMNKDELIYICYTLNNPNESLMNILQQFFNIGYHPIIATNEFNQITKLAFKLNNCIITIVNISYGSDVIVTEKCMDITDEQAEEFQSVNANLLGDFISGSYRSEYGDGFKFMLKHFKRCPRPLSLSAYEGEVVGIDNIKCYPSILAEVEELPVFYHDKFRCYKGEEIQDLNLYFVKKNVFMHLPYVNVLLEDSKGVVYGFVLKKLLDVVDVITCCVPTFIKPNSLGISIKDVFDNDKLSEVQKKIMVNSAIGKFGKTVKTINNKVSYYFNEDDALINMKNDSILMPLQVGAHKIYVVKNNIQLEYKSGYLPIQNLIYDKCRLRMYEKILEMDVECIGVKTDCIFIKKEDLVKFADIPMKNAIKGDVFENIGKWRVDEKAIYTPSGVGVMRDDIDYRKCIHPHFNDIITKIYTFEDEYNLKEEAYELLMKHGKIAIFGEYPGSGKSYLSKELVHYFGGHLIACPDNEQAANIGKYGDTYFSVCGETFGAESEFVKKKDMSAAYIIFEEVGKLDVRQLMMMQRYMKKHDSYYVANGDVIQIAPIESAYFNKSIDSKQYYKAIMDELFPYQILLVKPKRYNEEGKKLVKQLKTDIFYDNMPLSKVVKKYCKPIKLEDIQKESICVTYTNNSRKITNHHLHFKNHDKAYFNGCKLKANRRKIVDKKYIIQKNFKYVITDYGMSKTTIENVLSHELISVNTCELPDLFSYCYAYTGHSIQGQTKEEPIVVCDYDHYHVTKEWLYVALTRNKFFNLYSCKIGKEEMPTDGYIKKKIDGYKKQDEARGVDEANYIDVPYVKQLLFSQNFKCACCGENMNIANHEKSNDN